MYIFIYTYIPLQKSFVPGQSQSPSSNRSVTMRSGLAKIVGFQDCVLGEVFILSFELWMVRVKVRGILLFEGSACSAWEGTSVLQTDGNDQIEPSVVSGEISRKCPQ